MKKYFLFSLVIFCSFFCFLSSCYAFTTDEESAIEEFTNNYYDTDYPYCLGSYYNRNNTDYYLFYCSENDTDIYISNSVGTFKNRNSAKIIRHSLTTNANINYFQYAISETNSLSQQYFPIFVSNFDVYLLNSTLHFSKNHDFTGVDNYYYITFILPNNATLVLKDSNNEIVTPESGSIYYLLEGTYTYSVTKGGYNSLENIQLVVDEDKTINIELESSLNSTPYRNIYSQYYTYISQLITNMFGLENPLFLYIVAFIIGFSIITLIRRMIGGR